MRRYTSSALALVLLAGMFAFGFAQKASNTMVIALDAADLTTGDPHLAAATQDRAIADLVFNGLVRYQPGDISQIEPDIAQSWEPNDDGTVWTFHLRDDVMCQPWKGHDGYQLTSDDVVFSLQRSANPDFSAYAGEYDGMTFAATDAQTVTITLADPLSETLLLPKLADYAGGFIVCEQAVEDLGTDFQTHPVGTGPFVFDSYTPQQQVNLVANEAYFRGKPKLDGVTIRFIANVAAREAGLQTGELDIVEGPPEQPWVEKMRGQTDARVEVFGPGEAAVLFLDTSLPPFDQLEVRQAIAYCIDRDELRSTLGVDVTESLYAPVPAVLPGGLSEAEVKEAGLAYGVDRDKARSMLAEAGVENFSAEVVTSERSQYLTPMQNVQAQLAQCGVDLKLRVVDHSTMHTLIRQGTNLLTLYVAWRPNADVFLTRFYDSASAIVTGSDPDTNFSRIGTTDLDGDGNVDSVDEFIQNAKSALDSDEQIKLWKEAQVDILKWMAADPLYIQELVYAFRQDVDLGYELHSSLALYPQITENSTK